MEERLPPADYDSLRAEVTARYETLSKRLRQIANFAWDHPTDMAMETTAVIAKRAGVQPSALIRFAKAFGYAGFSAMQATFQVYVAERSASYKERIRIIAPEGEESNELAASLLNRYCEANTTALKQLRNNIDLKDLEHACNLLYNADHIYVMAQRRSYPIAAYLAYTLNHAGARAHLLDGVGGMLHEQVHSMSSKDAAIVVSFSPYSKDTEEVSAIAKKNKTPVIAITDSSFSPLAKNSTVCFEIQDAEVHSFRSLTASMCLAQVLATSMAFR
ncbi:MAG TPA: MurR/RpiR family transcriptional regulator [Gammaproteobacteria bacterium]